MRRSGIILPVFSLPSNYGIGTFGEEAYKFVDFLEKADVGYWQVLPMGPTSYGDSPYQSFSTFAGNPYFIDLDMLVEDKLLTQEEINNYDFGKNERYIDYETMYNNRYKVLKLAYKRAKIYLKEELNTFNEVNKSWLYDYALFMAIKDYKDGLSWQEWENDIRFRKPQAIRKYSKLLEDEINFYMFLQYMFNYQWKKLKKYANDKGIRIIGDIPIYVAEDSADIWSNPEKFMLNKNLIPKEVSGCPPDAFSETGQLWGNPIYDWNELSDENYKWWIERIKSSLEKFDVIRMDHFRGFESYWSIPYGEETAVNGKWKKGPGKEFFDTIKKEIGQVEVIAEDLGYITSDVRELLNYCGYPGMKVLQFAFDPKGDSIYLPHNYDKNAVVYTGTHDNNTIKGWFKSISEEERNLCKRYSDMKNENDNWRFIRLAISSVANLAILQIQDILNLGEEARINIPSTLGCNWKWRMKKDELTDEMAEKLKELNNLYGRK